MLSVGLLKQENQHEVKIVHVTQHWVERVAERISPKVNPYRLGFALVKAIQEGDTSRAQFVSRVNKEGQRLFRFRAKDSRVFYALIDTDQWCCITVLTPGMAAGRQGKSPAKLRGDNE